MMSKLITVQESQPGSAVAHRVPCLGQEHRVRQARPHGHLSLRVVRVEQYHGEKLANHFVNVLKQKIRSSGKKVIFHLFCL